MHGTRLLCVVYAYNIVVVLDFLILTANLQL